MVHGIQVAKVCGATDPGWAFLVPALFFDVPAIIHFQLLRSAVVKVCRRHGQRPGLLGHITAGIVA